MYSPLHEIFLHTMKYFINPENIFGHASHLQYLMSAIPYNLNFNDDILSCIGINGCAYYYISFHYLAGLYFMKYHQKFQMASIEGLTRT